MPRARPTVEGTNQPTGANIVRNYLLMFRTNGPLKARGADIEAVRAELGETAKAIFHLENGGAIGFVGRDDFLESGAVYRANSFRALADWSVIEIGPDWRVKDEIGPQGTWLARHVARSFE